MADEVSTGIKTTCLQYNSTGRSTFHIQVRNSSYFSFFFLKSSGAQRDSDFFCPD